MIKIPNYIGKTIYVLGLGKTGVASAEALLKSNANIITWDDNPETRAKYAKEFSIISPEQLQWQKISALLASPGIPLTYPSPHQAFILAAKYQVPIISDIELLMQVNTEATFFGITGTNGKSTTTSLLGHILNESGVAAEVGGNIGIPALSLKPFANGGNYVLELSSFQLELLKKKRLDVAIFLNISSDHANRYASYEDYINTKATIFEGSCHGVISIDYPELRTIYTKLQNEGNIKLIAISTQKPIPGAVCVKDDMIYDWTETGKAIYALPVNHSLMGRHNMENLAAAFAAARARGIPGASIAKTLFNFKGLEHRMEIVYKDNNLCYVNDSKGTNSNSTAQALQTFDNIYWIAGGLSKDDGFSELMQYRHKIAHVYLIGEAQEKFATILTKNQVPFTRAGDLANAFYSIEKDISKINIPKTVLLSPACASWDQWPDYTVRGNAFKELVRKKHK
jgi:UDP-N-acetylmuramoylalanine--D-glutamate ligase